MKLMCITLALLVISVTAALPAFAARFDVTATSLNLGMGLPKYAALDTLWITGYTSLNATAWQTLSKASIPFGLVLANGQTFIPDNAMAMNSVAPLFVAGEHVTQVGKRAFFGCISLMSVDFPYLMTIGDEAFYACSNLEDISLYDVTSMGKNAFRGCESLEYAYMYEMENIPEGAFANCYSLADIYMPRAKTIGRSAFDSNSALTEISLPLVTVVDSRAFYRSSIREISMPSVLQIGSEAFSGCTALRTLYLEYADPLVSEKAFEGVGRLTIYSNNRYLSSNNYPPYYLAALQDADGGAGGCSAGFSPFALLLSIVPLVIKKKNDN
jgi:Synergist-CTERM protein sorting domain-containing protein